MHKLIIPYIIKGGIHTYAFISNIFTMPGPDDDPFSTLLSTSVRSDIAFYVDSFYRSALASDEPLFSFQSRFIVSFVGIHKAETSAQHESLPIQVTDITSGKTYGFNLERTPSTLSYMDRFTAFSTFDESLEVLQSIKSAIIDMQSIPTEVSKYFFAADLDSEAIPLLPLSNTPSEALTNTPSPIPLTETFQMSLMDQVTSTLARTVAVARAGSRSISPQSLAVDSISGFPGGTLRTEKCIRKFTPVNLSLFDVALLAKVVHDYAPIYGIFDNQCYMFACVMFDAIVKLSSPDSSTPVFSTSNGEVKNENIVFVPNPGNPDQAGRWSGILIVDPRVKSAIVSVVVSRFHLERESYMAKFSVTA